jgi:hypothetical protein
MDDFDKIECQNALDHEEFHDSFFNYGHLRKAKIEGKKREK